MVIGVLLSADDRKGPKLSGEPMGYYGPSPALKIGDYPFPTNPMNDRAKGFLLQGKVKKEIITFAN